MNPGSKMRSKCSTAMPRAGIFEFYLHAAEIVVIGPLQPHRERAAQRHGAKRIECQIEEYLLQTVRVGGKFQFTERILQVNSQA